MLRDAISRLLARLDDRPVFPSQGATLFVDLARRQVTRAFTPRSVVEIFLEGRGANMFYLWNLLDPTLGPLHADVPLIFGNGLLTGIAPSAARGNVTSWSPETRLIMDSNAGDCFPSFLKLSGVDRLVLFGESLEWILLTIEGSDVRFHDARPYVGLDNIALRARLEADFAGREGKDLAIACVTGAGEKQVLCSAIMAGPKACFARGGTGAKMGALKVKAIVVRGFDARRGTGANPATVKAMNRELAAEILGASVVKNALKVRGTPFLYKPSRLLGAIGARNNQETTWTDALDAENLDPFRAGMTGCFRCPVNCRPLNNLDGGDGEGPDYVTLGKFGPMVGIADARAVIRLNNIANDLGLDSASTGSSIAWAIELWQRGVIGPRETGGLALEWGDAALVERLLHLTARREGFGDTLACSARAVDEGRYPREALRYRMAVKGLMQSDPHDPRIIKAFALGLAVATRGADHLRNRATLEINARINDDPAFKRTLYGADVSPGPNAYEGKARAVRVCEDAFAVGDSVGLCRFTTRLFNSPSLPGLDGIAAQVRNVTGLDFSPETLRRAGLAITGLERMLNHRLGARRADDTLPARWFDEGASAGAFKGERIDREAFEKMLDEFYALTKLDCEGRPEPVFRAAISRVVTGFAVVVRIPREALDIPGGAIVVTEPVATLGELVNALERASPDLAAVLATSAFNFVVNDAVVLHGERAHPISSGDRVEVIHALAGG